jgi:hypothetical protein
MRLTLYARETPEVLNRIGISFVMVGAANLDSARISFFGSTKGELAQKLDRGKDAAGCRWLIQVPPEPREMVTYYTAHKLCLGWGYLLFVGGTYGACRADYLCISYSVMEPSSAPPSQKERTEQPEAKSRV